MNCIIAVRCCKPRFHGAESQQWGALPAFYPLYFSPERLRTCTGDLSLDNSLSLFDPETNR